MNAIFRLLLFITCFPILTQAQISEAAFFNYQRGFYESPFSLYIESQNTEFTVKYTTDGSTPSSNNGSIFEDSLRINSNSIIRAALFLDNEIVSDVETHTYLFLDQVINQPATISGWPNQTYPTDYRGNSATHDYEMDPTIVDDPAYQNDLLLGLQEIPTVCLGTSLGEFWMMNDQWQEVPISVEILYHDRPEENHQANGGIEGMSHRHLKRSYRLEFKDIYGPKKFQSEIFESTSPLNRENVETQFDQLVLRGGTQRSWARNWIPNRAAFTRDQWYRDTQIEMSGVSMHGTYVHLYVNGVYFGLFNLIERPNAKFMEDYFGGEDSSYFVINHNGYVSGDPSRFEYLINELLEKDLSNPNHYQEFSSFVDISQFIDYLILTWITGMVDWPNNNYYASMTAEQPLRLFAWDCEQSWDYEFGANQGAWVHPVFRKDETEGPFIAKLFNRAKRNSDFMIAFADRVYKHCFENGALTDANSRARWDTLSRYIEKAVVAESARWGDGLDDGVLRTRDQHWRQAIRDVDAVMDGNVAQFIEALQAEDYYPQFEPPRWSAPSHAVDSGYSFIISNPNTQGTVYYRLDGQDPREAGGQLSAEAIPYTGPIVLSQNVVIKARVHHHGVWSALNQVQLLVIPPLNTLYLNEFLAKDSTQEDWIEIYNSGSKSIPLGGLYISDKLDNPSKWQLPFDTTLTISAGGHLLLWADSKEDFGPQHLNFKLNGDGEAIGLFSKSSTGFETIDMVEFDQQEEGVSYGRLGDGRPTWGRQFVSTPEAPNYIPAPPSDPNLSPLLINEFMASNNQTIADEQGKFEDWVEIFNPDSIVHDVGGLFLTDNSSQPTLWQIPQNMPELTRVGPGEHLLIWLDSDLEEGILHAPFKLKASGEFIGLVQQIEGNLFWLDSLSFGPQQTDISFGRISDGNLEWSNQSTPTPNGPNQFIPPIAPPQFKRLFVNEILPINNSGIINEQGDFQDWIELFNASKDTFDLGGLYISDERNHLQKDSIPIDQAPLTEILPYSHLLLWADKQEDLGPLHLNFAVPDTGGTIWLSQDRNGELVIIDSLSFGNQPADQSFGRYPDGANTSFTFSLPSPESKNIIAPQSLDCRGRWPATYVLDSCGQCLLPDDPAFNTCLIEKEALLIVGEIPLVPGDLSIKQLLDTMGFVTQIQEASSVQAQDSFNQSVILISATTDIEQLTPALAYVATPILSWHPLAYEKLGMSYGRKGGVLDFFQKGKHIVIQNPSHPIVHNIPSRPEVYQNLGFLNWAIPEGEVSVIATLPSDPRKVTLFAYEKDDLMVHLNAPEKRVGIFLDAEGPSIWTYETKALFRAAICWLGGCELKAPINLPPAQEDRLAPFHTPMIYPNPGDSFIKLQMPTLKDLLNLQSKIMIKFLNPMGQLVHKEQIPFQSEVGLSISHLSPGMYILEITFGKERWNLKMLKEK